MNEQQNTRAMKSRIMKMAWHIRAINQKEYYGNWTKSTIKFTWSECLILAWKLIKSWSGKLGERVREHIELFRPNGAGFLRSQGYQGITYTMK